MRMISTGLLFLSTPALAQSLPYPASECGPVVDDHFGENVADPYRWLENDVRADPKVEAWVEAENLVTQRYLDSLPKRDAIKKRLTQLWNFERWGVPVKMGARWFVQRNSGLQNQSPLYVMDDPHGEPQLLIDPNLWAKDGATALADWVPSEDGHHVVYAIQNGGSDWRTLRVLDVDTGNPLADEVKWVKFSNLAWAKDGSGFYYSRFPEPKAGDEFQSLNTRQAVYFHRLGDKQPGDRLVYGTPDRPALGHSAQVTDDGRWLVITTSEGTDDRYEVSTKDLSDPDAEVRTIFEGLNYSWQLVGSEGSRLIFITNKDAPRYRLVRVDASEPSALTELIPQADGTIENANIIGDELVVTVMEDAKDAVQRYSMGGELQGNVPLPGIGSVSGFSGKQGDKEAFYSFSSFNRPATVYRYEAGAGKSSVFRAPKVAFDPEDFVVEQRFYASKDGTRVPMYIVQKKGLDLGEGAPTLLYGYGGFNVSLKPSFSVARLGWLETGGVFALANIRGGGEYGKAWHDAGRLSNKQNVFDDFIAAGEYLIAQGITTKGKLAIQGGSNGGLLVGAVVNQRPDLFAVALPAVGVMDMLRFNQFTAGRYWTDDYGDPAKEQDYRILRAYSPYHNIHPGVRYPAILVTTADTDDRVVPGHSFKYTAALQAADIGPEPHLIRVETRAGHGSGKPTDKQIAEYADMWAFIGFHTGLATSEPNLAK